MTHPPSHRLSEQLALLRGAGRDMSGEGATPETAGAAAGLHASILGADVEAVPPDTDAGLARLMAAIAV